LILHVPSFSTAPPRAVNEPRASALSTEFWIVAKKKNFTWNYFLKKKKRVNSGIPSFSLNDVPSCVLLKRPAILLFCEFWHQFAADDIWKEAPVWPEHDPLSSSSLFQRLLCLTRWKIYREVPQRLKCTVRACALLSPLSCRLSPFPLTEQDAHFSFARFSQTLLYFTFHFLRDLTRFVKIFPDLK
jgi:hypothetical protein